MKTSQKLKLILSSLRAGGNCGFIAQNIACIYYCVQKHPNCSHLSDDEKLYATALIDSIPYLHAGAVSLDEIKLSVLSGTSGVLTLLPHRIRHRDLFDYEDNASLVGMTMQLEALFFSVDTTVSQKQILDTVISKKKQILKMIQKTLRHGPRCPLYDGISVTVDMYLSQPEMMDIIEDFDS